MADFDRREFLKLVGVSAGATAAAGCQDHVEKLIPYVVQPEEITPGIPVVYASTCRECPAACGLHVKTRESRPIKLEGNPDHPVNQGALCARGQASIGRTYDPDRFQGPMRRNASGTLEPIGWDEATALLAGEIAKAPGRTFVLGGDAGHTASDLVDRFVSAVGAGGRVVYEPFAQEALREATREVFGVGSIPVFDLEGTDLVIDFGSDLLETGLSPTEHTRQISAARDISSHPHGGARLVAVSPRLSLTASNADEWLAAKPGSEGILALALARVAIESGAGAGEHQALLGGLLADFDAASAAAKTDVPAETITRLGQALASAKRPVAMPPGVASASRRAVDATGAVLLLNYVIGAVGQGVTVPAEATQTVARASYRETLSLVKAMEAGKVSVLLIHDANPVYSIPKVAGFEAALAKVQLVVSFSSASDETSTVAGLVLPDHTPLESWGDAMARDGVHSLVQPTVRPLYDTRAFGDTLLDVGRQVGEQAATKLPSGSFRGLVEGAFGADDFRTVQAAGGRFAAASAEPVSLAAGAARLEVVEPVLTGSGSHTLVAFPHGFLYDGRGANLPWLQEIPDSVTKIAWDSWAEVSTATAESLGLELGDVVAIETSAGSIEVPVYVRGGIRDDVIAVPIGQGHTVGMHASRDGAARGVNVLDALSAAVDESGGRAWLTEQASVTPTGGNQRLPLLQFSANDSGRMLGETISLVALAEAAHGDGHGEGHGDDSLHMLAPYEPAADAAEGSEYRWGMSVDLDRCTGCSACVAACYVENNIPVVGEDETRKVRQMAWLRINRYVGEGEQDLSVGRIHPAANREGMGDNNVRHTPMMCQQCGSAPCEPVCPVIATYHNEEGLNGMIYNRCIGTRYCANNCPYKVRRFNYFDNQLTKWPEPMRLMLNPDVTVRGQGVMEKCTYCVQRIQTARQPAKDQGRPIADGDVKTACQQACPASAITFGNLRDPESEVSTKEKDDVRGYKALEFLNTRPGTTYLAKVRRGTVEA